MCPVFLLPHLGRWGLENPLKMYLLITLWRMCLRPLEVQYVKLLRKVSFFWWFISLTSLSVLPALRPRPPWSLHSLPFPPTPPFSSCHSWVGGPSLWEVKGHRGWEGSRQVARALCTPLLKARVRILLNPDPGGSSCSESTWKTQFSLPDPIQDWTFYWKRKERTPSNPNCGHRPSFCLPVKKGRTTGRHLLEQDFRKSHSACDLTPRFQVWLTWIKRWESLGVLFHWIFRPLKCTLFTTQNDWFFFFFF